MFQGNFKDLFGHNFSQTKIFWDKTFLDFLDQLNSIWDFFVDKFLWTKICLNPKIVSRKVQGRFRQRCFLSQIFFWPIFLNMTLRTNIYLVLIHFAPQFFLIKIFFGTKSFRLKFILIKIFWHHFFGFSSWFESI